MSWWSRLVNAIRISRLDEELDEEQQFHIEARADELEARGLSRTDALAQASRLFGNRLRLREASRDVKLLTALESVLRDFRLGLRLLRKDAVVSSATVLSLALAIGACTAAFSLIDALILRELPVRDPHALVHLNRTGSSDQRFSSTFSYPYFDRVRQSLASQVDVFSMSAQSLRQAVLPDGGGAEEKLRAQFVSGNAFGALGVTPAIGRLLTPADDVTPGAHQVAVISHAFWTRRFGANPAVLGQWIQIEQQPYQIVGVAPAGFTGVQPGMLTDVWAPNMMFRRDAFTLPNWNWLYVWGRLAPGVTREAIAPIVSTSFANFEIERAADNKAMAPRASELAIDAVDAATGMSALRREFQRPLLVLGAIVGAVLLIACSNVANLLLARGAARSREMALRASIGAGRGRLVQQVLIESSVVTLAATSLAIVCASAGVPFIIGMLTTNEEPVYLDARFDWRVLLFVAGLGSLTTVLFGLAPALRASGATPAQVSASGEHRFTAGGGMARSLVAAQIAFSVMLLFVAALLLRSFDRLLRVDLGFVAEGVALLSVETRDRLDAPQARVVGRQLLERVQSMPGVESAAISGWALFRGWTWGTDVGVQGRGYASTLRLAVSPQFFRTMRIPVIDGREFQTGDTDAADPMPVIVNEAFARKYLPGGRAVGRRLSTTRQGRAATCEIVGLVGNAHDLSVRREVGPYVFSPIGDAGGTIEIRSALDSRSLAGQLRRELPQVHASLRLVDVTAQSALVRNTLLRERLLAVLSGFFAALGLVLAAIGLYGVLSYAVVRRTREIGIRMTLGAEPAAVIRSVLGRVATAVAAGIVAGLGGGVYFAAFVQTLLFDVERVSISSVAWPLLWLLGIAAVASWFPARRATRVDPAEALRME